MVRLDLNGLCPGVCLWSSTTAIISARCSVKREPGNGRDKERVDRYDGKAGEVKGRTVSEAEGCGEQRR
jgi:hypothetical protein